MTADDYKAWLERHALTHAGAGEALGLSKATSSRYAAGQLAIPLVVELALETLDTRWRQRSRKAAASRATAASRVSAR